LKAYIIVNFRGREINKNACKLYQVPILIKKKNKNPRMYISFANWYYYASWVNNGKGKESA
jgi:hypothetical protein